MDEIGKRPVSELGTEKGCDIYVSWAFNENKKIYKHIRIYLVKISYLEGKLF